MFLQWEIQQITQCFSLFEKSLVVDLWWFTIKGEGQAVAFDCAHADGWMVEGGFECLVHGHGGEGIAQPIVDDQEPAGHPFPNRYTGRQR